MEIPHEDQGHRVKRVQLPSGRTIEVVYFSEAPGRAPAPDQELHVCLDCGSGLVFPVEWHEEGPESWSVLLRCPNCHVEREGVFAQHTVERFDAELDRGADELAAGYRRLVRVNMEDELERFVGALQADAILPEDFGAPQA